MARREHARSTYIVHKAFSFAPSLGWWHKEVAFCNDKKADTTLP